MKIRTGIVALGLLVISTIALAQTPMDQIALGMVSRDISRNFGNQGILLDGLGKINIYMGISRLDEYHVRNHSMKHLAQDGLFSVKSRTFFANYFKDFNNNGLIDVGELVGIDKRIFKRNESFCAGEYLSKDANHAADGLLKIYNPRGVEVYSKNIPFTTPGKGQWTWKNFEVSIIYNTNGPGTYAAAFYYEGNFWEARSFEVTE
jgi:hypothetical protein